MSGTLPEKSQLSGGSALRNALEPIFWVLLLIIVVSLIQFSLPYPLDDDTAYHFSVARLVREQGILQNFPWTRFSWQLDHYADKEFLFHVLFIPFTPLGFNAAARIVGTICGSSILAALYFILRAERVRFAGFWAMLPLGTIIFVYRFAQVRPHLLSITLAICLLWAYCRGRKLLIFIVAMLYPLCYVAFWQIPLIIVVVAEAAKLAIGQRGNWRHFLIVVAGVATGLVFHPNSFNLLQMNWIHMTDILFRNAWGKHVEFNMGEEFEPFSLIEWIRYLLVTGVAASWAIAAAWRQRKESLLATAMAGVLAVFFLLTLRTNRFLEYLVPFTFLTCALIPGSRFRGRTLSFLALASLILLLLGGQTQMKYMFSGEQRPWQMSESVAGRLRKEIPAGANIFTCGWEYTGTLMVELPGRNYLVALDPTLLYKRDPELYDLWYRTLLYAPPDSAGVVRNSFVSRYVICLDHPTLHPFFNAVSADPDTMIMYNDGKWVLFDLGPGLQGRK